eukprot:CAMPEP_0204592588 /NCGR_PEP_ID=MMETSP0661-20131031/51022_1 /ASSEMBLY_ACC=CAM_ASM_000606 /TAXON_ID=109239 /ORGANISM="Alexandrium margalefi, Strain AMGDE01CS-322" /LENGTH=103 /DNA_ID=CAMNT_0051602825 /DNA_START=124 /DNA_END=432 /DNA_ORIENTATION=-
MARCQTAAVLLWSKCQAWALPACFTQQLPGVRADSCTGRNSGQCIPRSCHSLSLSTCSGFRGKQFAVLLRVAVTLFAKLPSLQLMLTYMLSLMERCATTEAGK